jgi:hypothetical protein
MVFVSAVSPCEGTDVSGRGGAVRILKGRTVGEGILDFDCATAGEFGGTLKGFTGVGICGYGTLWYFNAKADWNIDIMRSAHTRPYTKRMKSGVSRATQSVIQGLNTHQ